MDGTKKTLVIIALLIAAVVLSVVVYRAGQSSSGKGYEGNGGKGFWESLWNNAANIVDAGGRHTASTVTSTTNGIASIIATAQAKNGRAVFSRYGYSDEKPDYGPYIIGGAVVLAAGVVAAVSLSKR